MSEQLDATPAGQPEGEKVFGKYANIEEAQKGYFSAVEEMNKTKAQLNMAVEMIDKLQKGGQPTPAAPVRPEYETQLEQYGVPVAAVKAMIEARAAEIAEKAVQTHLTPLASGANARQQMAQAYPDYRENEAEVMKFVKSSPELANRFEDLLTQNRPYDALELGYFHWTRNKPVQPASGADAAAKAAAGMPGGAGAAARTPQGMVVGKEERLSQAAEHFFETKDFMPLFNEKLGDAPLTWSEQMERFGRQG